MKSLLWLLSCLVTLVLGIVIPNQPISQNAWPNAWRRTASIEDLPIDWRTHGIDKQAVQDFASYLACVEQKLQASHSPDECLSENNNLAQAKAFEAVFDIVYWLPEIELALLDQLDKYKPKDCSAAHATCTASTPDEICPPWRYVDPSLASTDASAAAAGAADDHPEEASDVASTSTNGLLTQPTYGRPVDATATATAASTSTNGTLVYSGFVPVSTDENDAASSASGRTYGLLTVAVPVAAGVFVALLM